MECTYGDRTHPPIEDASRKLAAIIRETAARGGRVYIPSFALERAQELLFALGRLQRSGEIPDLPVFVDSPLAIAVTEIYKLHPDALDPAIRDQLLGREDPFSPRGLRYVSDISASQALQATHEPAIIIAGSGMCEGGRILHHLARALGDAKHSVVLVGFQAQHTLGRRLAEGRREVRVFGVERDVWCQVHQLAGLSAHADQRGLLEFARATARRGHLGEVVLVHGEDDAKHALAERLKAEGLGRVTAGTPGRVIALVPGPGRRGGG
jgi:metallo-beta-lactamase family protein